MPPGEDGCGWPDICDEYTLEVLMEIPQIWDVYEARSITEALDSPNLLERSL
jgi:hypothetical protein